MRHDHCPSPAIVAAAIGLCAACAQAGTVQPMPPMPDLDSLTRARTADRRGAFVEATVDEPPALMAAPPLRYPSQLYERGIQGWVVLQFVIDTLGLAEPASVTVLVRSHPDFVEAARRVILESRYRPGYVKGIPVRVLVQQQIHFAIQGSSGMRAEESLQRRFGVSYVTNLPRQVLGVGLWLVPQRRVGVYLDVKTGVPFRDGASNFFDDLTVDEVNTVFGDPFVRTDPNWMSVNLALTKAVMPRLAVYLGGGVSGRFEYLEYRDAQGVLVDRGDTYWIEDDNERKIRPNVITGVLIELGSRVRLQVGGELQPAGLTVGLGFHPAR